MKLPFGINITRTGKPQPQAYARPPLERKQGSWSVYMEGGRVEPANVQAFKDALASARSNVLQERGTLYNYYQDALDFDTTVRAVIEKRLLATTCRRLQYTINDQPVESVQPLLDSPVMTKLIEDILMAKVFWGMGVFEFAKQNIKGVDYIQYYKAPIKHIDPYEQMVRVYEYSSSPNDVNYAKLPNTLFVGNSDDYGLLLPVAIHALWKRSGMSDWAEYSQLAARNFTHIKYKGDLPDALRRKDTREQVYQAGSGVLDSSDMIDVEIQNQTSTSQNQLFEGFTDYIDTAITRLVLGQDMTTMDGSSQSQAEVHERTQESIFDADAKLVTDWLNYEFYEVQSLYGIPEGGKWEWVESVSGKQEKQIELDLKLKELGVMFTDQELREKYQI